MAPTQIYLTEQHATPVDTEQEAFEWPRCVLSSKGLKDSEPELKGRETESEFGRPALMWHF